MDVSGFQFIINPKITYKKNMVIKKGLLVLKICPYSLIPGS